jgi:hypothetical protein
MIRGLQQAAVVGKGSYRGREETCGLLTAKKEELEEKKHEPGGEEGKPVKKKNS